jgi:4-hydroxy-tetrahydrodipicolinate synthase
MLRPGVIPALVLPFRPDETIDEDAFRSLADRLSRFEGVTALAVNGVAGEADTLSAEEQLLVVSLAVEATKGRVAIVAGISGESPRMAREKIDAAMDAGAVAVLIQAPSSFARGIEQSPDTAVSYFRELARSRAPMIVFQHQVATRRAYPIQTLLRLLEIEECVAVKETIWDVERYEAEVRAIRRSAPTKLVFCANDTLLLPSLAICPADGVLVGLASIVPELVVQLFESVGRGDLAAARALADRMWPIVSAAYAPPALSYYPRLKAAMWLAGMLPNAVVRAPLASVSNDELATLRNAVSAARLGRAEPNAPRGEGAVVR